MKEPLYIEIKATLYEGYDPVTTKIQTRCISFGTGYTNFQIMKILDIISQNAMGIRDLIEKEGIKEKES